ncbi:cytochrome P450 [Xylariaceae sp. FL1019]|nr:cytochrome P450 [Xylariaceae sp. FL1019]
MATVSLLYLIMPVAECADLSSAMAASWSRCIVTVEAVGFASCIFFAYCVVVALYRVYLHPLAGYPGPFLAKVTDGYAGFHALMMRLHLATWDDHQRYGPVIRHGPNKLVFNSATALRSIYVGDRLTKSSAYLATLHATKEQNTWSTIDKHTHRFRRRKISAVFLEPSLATFEPTLLGEIQIFLGVILSKNMQPIDMTILTRYLSLDITGHLAFGHANRAQTSPKARFLSIGLTAVNYHCNVMMQFPSLAQSWIVAVIHRLTADSRRRTIRSLEKVMERRIHEPVDAKKDLYRAMVRDLGSDERDKVPLDLLFSEAAFMYAAGVETTSTAISALLFYLSRNPICYGKLVSEIREVFTSGCEIRSGTKLNSCRYLRACIDETLRMSPSSPGTLWREMLRGQSARNQQLVIDGHVIPHGTQVGVCTYAIHHNERYFPDSFKFSPDRWLRSDKKVSEPSAFVPFSLGHRACPGKQLAYLEISLIMASLLWYFDIRQPDGHLRDVGGGKPGMRGGRGRVDEFQLYDVFTATHKGPMLSFVARENFCEGLSCI